MNLPAIPTGLKTQLRKNNTVLFVGAGLSRGAGYPDWKGLVKGILTRLDDKETKSAKYIQALNDDLLDPLEVLTKIEHLRPDAIKAFYRFMRTFSNVKPNQIHSKISQLSSKMITTNYDDLLEKSYPDFEKFTWNQPALYTDMKDYQNYIFKFHGDLGDPERCILFPKDYEELYSPGAQGAVLELQKICSDQSIIFLGFSLSDPYINKVLDYISKIYQGYSSEHYIITTEKKDVWSQKINAILINDHSELEGLIDLLIETKTENQKQFHQISQQPLKSEPSDAQTTILALLLPAEIVLVDRQDKLAEITTKLQAKKPLIITGIRGQGKTSLAQHWISRNKDQFNNIAFVNITGDMHLSFINAFQNSTNIQIAEDSDSRSSQIVEDIIRQLNEKHGNNLLFIDNANNGQELNEFMNCFLNKLQSWKILITSITKPLPDYQPVIDILEISTESGRRIFEFYAGCKFSSAEKEILNNFVEELFLNPLLIEFAAIQYKEQFEFYSTSLSSYAAELISRKKQLFESPDSFSTTESRVLPNSGNVAQYLNQITTDSFNALSPVQQQILLYFSILPSNFYSFEMLNYCIPGINKDILPQLVTKCWLRFNHDEGGSTFKMHEMFQIVVRHKILPGSTNCSQLINRFNEILLLDNAVNKDKTVFDIQQYIPMAEEMIRHFNIASPNIPYDDEAQLKELLTENKREKVGAQQRDDCPELVDLLILLSECMDRLSNRKLAFNDSLKALFITLRIYDNDNYQTARAYGQTGYCIARYEKNKHLALEYRLLAKEISDADSQTPEIFKIRLMRHLGNNYRNLSEYDNSIYYLKKGIDILELKNGKYAITLSSFYDNLGFTYDNIGRRLLAENPSCDASDKIKLSLEYRLKALVLKEKTYSDIEHISIAKTHNNIGTSYSRLNDLNSAEYHYLKCYGIRQRKFPENHESLAIIKNNIAGLYRTRVHSDKGILSFEESIRYLEIAEQLCNESIAITEKTYPDSNAVAFGPKFRVKAQILLERYYILRDNLLKSAESAIESALTAIKNSAEPDRINIKESENIQQEILLLKQKNEVK